jgi:hypothetical protein
MQLAEVLGLHSNWSREELRMTIESGVTLPDSTEPLRLRATPIGDDYDITEADLDAYFEKWDEVEPGRWPSAGVRRTLLVEANHRCGICKERGPIDFHHILEYSRLRHYDTRHMIAICPTCHRLCTTGKIDRKAQQGYKRSLTRLATGPMYLTTENAATRFSWDDLREVLEALHGSLHAEDSKGESRFDFSDVEIQKKNDLNNLGAEAFEDMLSEDEPFFGKIDAFLHSPANQELSKLYFELVDEMRRKIIADRDQFDRFEHVLERMADVAVVAYPDRLKGGKRRVLRTLLSFMYLNCDIGRKLG